MTGEAELTRLIGIEALGAFHQWVGYVDGARVTVLDGTDYEAGAPLTAEIDGWGRFEIDVTVRRLPGGNRWRECAECNHARHTCPGCGDDIEHGQIACSDCSDRAPRSRDEVRLDLERRLQVRREMVAAEIPERFELEVHEEGGVAHFLAVMDQHFGLPGEGTCPECTDYTDDPSTWCDCGIAPDDLPCNPGSTCKQCAHHPMNCPLRKVEVFAKDLHVEDEIFSDVTGGWHRVLSVMPAGPLVQLTIDRNDGTTFTFKVAPDAPFTTRCGPAHLLAETLGTAPEPPAGAPRWIAAGTPASEPYPCRCTPGKQCSPLWCPDSGRIDTEILPDTCCAHRFTPDVAARAQREYAAKGRASS